jgi:multiple sugar transport system substrate-binding protein
MTRRTLSRRSVLGGGLGLTAAALLAACQTTPTPQPGGSTGAAPAAKPAAASGEKVKLDWWSHTYKPWNEELTRQKDKYQQDNGKVEINYVIQPGAELVTKYTTAMQAGTGPDIVGANIWMTPSFIHAGFVSEAPDWAVKDIRERFFPVAVDGATFRGKIWGYNQHIGSISPIVNAGLLEEVGAQIPTSWDEAFALTDKLDKKEGSQFTRAGGIFGFEGEPLMNSWWTVLRTHGAEFLSKDLKTAAFNSDAGKKATALWARFVHPEFSNITEAFGQGKGGMIVSGSWLRPSLEPNFPSLKFKVIPILKGPAGQVHGDYVWNWLVGAKIDDARKDASWKFSQWLTGTENQVTMVKASSLLPTTKESREHPEVLKDEWLKVHVENLSNKETWAAKISNWPQVQKAIGDEFALAATGSQSMDDALKKGEAAVNLLLKEAEVYA